MGLVNNCSDEFATCSGTPTNVYSSTGAAIDFNNCPAYQAQAGNNWGGTANQGGLTDLFYGTTDSVAVNNFATSQMAPDSSTLDAGWWLWLPTYVVDSAGVKHSLICSSVLEPCNSLSASQLHGVYYDPSWTGGPANGWCSY